MRNCGEYEYWLPWLDAKNIGGRFNPSVNVGDKLNPKRTLCSKMMTYYMA